MDPFGLYELLSGRRGCFWLKVTLHRITWRPHQYISTLTGVGLLLHTDILVAAHAMPCRVLVTSIGSNAS